MEVKVRKNGRFYGLYRNAYNGLKNIGKRLKFLILLWDTTKRCL